MTISPENGYASVIFTLRKPEKNASVIFKLGAAENGSWRRKIKLWWPDNRHWSVRMQLREPVSSKISDITPYTHPEGNILLIKYIEKTDD